MNNWIEINQEEMKIGMGIAGLKKGELQIKYAKDVYSLQQQVEQLVLEIEQLRTELNTKNNIINELEKILSTEMYKDIAVAKCLDKLKELKDSD